MSNQDKVTNYGASLDRRRLIQLGTAGVLGLSSEHQLSADEASKDKTQSNPNRDREQQQRIRMLDSYLTNQEDFQDVSRGNPKPHMLPDHQKSEAGLTRETWSLQVISDSEYPATIDQPLSTERGTALNFEQLMQLAKKNSVRFAKLMTCLNIGCPLGMGVWEGVPLRDVLWLTGPKENLRRVFYYGYHNDDPEQIFRSSLPVGRVLEDPFDLPPVILCYKLNGEWLNSQRGGPVRIVVPEAYGFKSVKWLSHVVLSNLSHANDTYAEKNNDIDSPMKTFASALDVPRQVEPDSEFQVRGYAQVGISGLQKIQVWLHQDGQPLPSDRVYFSDAEWQDAQLLSPPVDWGRESNSILRNAWGFDAKSRPQTWPMRLTKALWQFDCPGLAPGNYTFRCRTIDEKGMAQPLPRPFRKSGHAAIEQRRILVGT